MLDSKKAFIAIGMSVVLSSYLMATAYECTTVGSKYQVKNANNTGSNSLRICLDEADYHGGTVSFLEDMNITLTSNIYIRGSDHVIVDGEGKKIIISGGDTSRIFMDANSNKITLKDLTIKNGYTEDIDQGAGVRINNEGDVDIDNVTFSDNNNSDGSGGAVYIDNEEMDTDVVVNITGSTFLRNGSTTGGAIYSGGGVELNIDGTEFRENYDISGGGNGAGIYADYGVELSISNSSFTQNISENNQGHNGVAIFTGSFTTLDIDNTTFSLHDIILDASSNTAMIKMSNSSTLTINESEFYDNNITLIDALLSESNATIRNSTVRDNESERKLIKLTADNIDINSSKFINNTNESVLFDISADKVTIDNSEFIGNRAFACAAISSSSNDTTVSNTTISDNSAFVGSSICVLGSSSFKIVNSTISGNTSLYNAVYSEMYSGTVVVSDSSLTIDSSTIVNNQGENGTVAGIYSYAEGNSIQLNNTILTNNIVNSSQSNANKTLDMIASSIVGSDVNASTELDVQKGIDPKLRALADNGGDTKTHALLSSSPAIDAGYSTLLTDQRGMPRKGTPDIGSYEYQGGGVNPAIIMYLLK